MGNKNLEYPSNWKEVREKVLNQEMSVSKAIKELRIGRKRYYELVEAEVSGDTEETEISPAKYFQELKSSIKEMRSDELLETYNNAKILMDGFEKSGQVKSMEKMNLIMDAIVKEYQLIKLGITTFVYRDDLERFLNQVEKSVVKAIELPRYERPIPPDITEAIEATKDIFDSMIVVFTDYTGKVEKEVAKERREKDPVLFGCFMKDRRLLSNRLYFLGDWEDDLCDLTLESIVSEMREKTGEDISHEIKGKYDIKELEDRFIRTVRVENAEEDKGNEIATQYDEASNPSKLKNAFRKVRSFLKKR